MTTSRDDLDAVSAVVEILEPFNPNDRERILRWSSEKLGIPGGDILGLLFFIFRESIMEQNEDKQYWLSKLKDLNAVADELSSYLEELNKASQKLSESEVEDEKVEIKRRQINWEALQPKTDKYSYSHSIDSHYDVEDRVDIGVIGLVNTRVVKLSRSEISAEIINIESERERLRNERQSISNKFQHLDQVTNQTLQGIARVLRTLGAMRTGVGLAKGGL